jgi:hypothetical protein
MPAESAGFSVKPVAYLSLGCDSAKEIKNDNNHVLALRADINVV